MKITYLVLASIVILPMIPGSAVRYEAVADQAPEVIRAIVTAYTSSVDETDDNPWETASGTKPGPGTIACPAKLPFGTIVEIDGQFFTCEDRMNKRYRETEHYDVWLGSKEEAMNWGKKELAILVH